MRNISLIAALTLGLACATADRLCAATVDWAVWSSITPGTPVGGLAAGTVTGSNIAYTGEALASSYTGFGPPPAAAHPSWTPVTTFSGGTVGNAPSNSGSIALSGGAGTGLNTLTFSQPVIDPVMAIWSLGSGSFGTPASFNFLASEPFTIQAGGPNTETGGQSIGGAPPIVIGIEGNGVVQFTGTYSSLSWTNPSFENDYAFTVGVEGVVPEPASLSLLALAALSTLKRRRARA